MSQGFFPPPSKPKVIGIVGSRRRATDADQLLLMGEFTKIFNPGDRLVSGGCPTGGDAYAEWIAKKKGLTITIHYPNWDAGKHAGFERNSKIAEDCDILLALVASDRTGGTEDTIEKTKALGKKVIIL